MHPVDLCCLQCMKLSCVEEPFKGCRRAPEVGLLGQRCQLRRAGARRPRTRRFAITAGHALLLRCKLVLGCRQAEFASLWLSIESFHFLLDGDTEHHEKQK